MSRRSVFRFCSSVICIILVLNQVSGPQFVHGQSLFVANLPEPGRMLGVSSVFTPVLVKGLVVHPDHPLELDLVVDCGHDTASEAVVREAAERAAQYFLAAVTVPEDQLWVNLSPFEKGRIIEKDLGQTVLGRDMLAQDYVLKQFASSLLYPESSFGKKLWEGIYKESAQRFGTSDVPVDELNKVWIMPGKAEVFERSDGVYVTEARLKVMLDADRSSGRSAGPDAVMSQARAVMQSVILPLIEREVNEGENFAVLRQIYHAAILAKWYRGKIKDTFMAKAYLGKNKVKGILTGEKRLKEEIYQRYIAAYKKGVFNFIKEEVDPQDGEIVPRKYFSGGLEDFAMKDTPLTLTGTAAKAERATGKVFTVALALRHADAAATLPDDGQERVAEQGRDYDPEASPDERLDWLMLQEPLFAARLGILKEYLPRIIARKQSHVVNVYGFFYLLRHRQFDKLYSLLPENEKAKVSFELYEQRLGQFFDLYQNLSEALKERLLTMLIFHDIGALQGERDWTHNRLGMDLTRELLQGLGASLEFSDAVAQGVLYHNLPATIGADCFPEEFMRRSEEEKDLLLLMNLADIMSGKDGGNTAGIGVMDKILGQKAWVARLAADPALFVKDRWGRLFSLFLLPAGETDARYQEIEKVLTDLDASRLEDVKKIWQGVRVNVFGIFWYSGIKDITVAARLIHAVALRILDEPASSTGGDIELETDVDIMGLRLDDPQAWQIYLDALKAALEAGDDIPMHFHVTEDQRRQLVIDLDKIVPVKKDHGGLDNEGLKVLKDYIDAFYERYDQYLDSSRVAMEQALLDSSVISIPLYSVPLQPGEDKAAWFKRVLDKDNYFGLQQKFLNEMPRELVAALYERKMMSGPYEASIRDFLVEYQKAKGALSDAEAGFFAGLAPGRPLSEQGVRIDRLTDQSSGRVYHRGTDVFRVVLTRNGGEIVFYLKGFGRSQVDEMGGGHKVEQNDAFMFNLLGALGFPTTVARYYPAGYNSKDPMLGFTLMGELSGADTNLLFDRTGLDFRIRKEYTGYQDQLIREFARLGAANDLVHRGDRKIIQNYFTANKANFLFNLAKLSSGEDAVIILDHTYIFNETNQFSHRDLRIYGSSELGIILAFEGHQGATFKDLMEVYRRAYVEQWQKMRASRQIIGQLVAATYGESSLEHQIFSASMDQDPDALLSIQEKELLTFRTMVRGDLAQNGGVDLKDIKIADKAGSFGIRFNEIAVAEVMSNGFNGFSPEIIKVTPLASIVSY